MFCEIIYIHTYKINVCAFISLFSDGIVGPGTITSPWTPVSAGHPGSLGPADSNGSMVDSKNLDVGDMSDVSTTILKNYAKGLKTELDSAIKDIVRM